MCNKQVQFIFKKLSYLYLNSGRIYTRDENRCLDEVWPQIQHADRRIK